MSTTGNEHKNKYLKRKTKTKTPTKQREILTLKLKFIELNTKEFLVKQMIGIAKQFV